MVLQANIVLLRATLGCGLTCCSPRPHCAIKGAAGNNGDDDDDDDYGTDAAITNNDDEDLR